MSPKINHYRNQMQKKKKKKKKKKTTTTKNSKKIHPLKRGDSTIHCTKGSMGLNHSNSKTIQNQTTENNYLNLH
jgi:hypothetical protein